VVYTFGIPLFLFWRLHQSRRHLYEEECPHDEMHKHAIVKRRLGAIYDDYTPSSYYFDLLDMLRRLLLTGGLILLGESSNVQIFIGGLICTCWLCLVLIKRPYRAHWDNALSVATSFQLLLIILSGMALEIYRLTPQYAQDPYQKQAFGMFMVVASVGVIAAGCLVLLIAVPCVRDRCARQCGGVSAESKDGSGSAHRSRVQKGSSDAGGQTIKKGQSNEIEMTGQNNKSSLALYRNKVRRPGDGKKKNMMRNKMGAKKQVASLG
jgi:hypothetical protein